MPEDKNDQQASADDLQKNTDHQKAELDKITEQLDKARHALETTEKEIERKKREAKMAKEGMSEDDIRTIVREESEAVLEQLSKKDEENESLRKNLGDAVSTLTETQKAVDELRKSLDSKSSKSPGGDGGQKPPPPENNPEPELAPYAKSWLTRTGHVWDSNAINPKTGKKGAWVIPKKA